MGRRSFCSKLVKTKNCIMILQNLLRCARYIQLCPEEPTATAAAGKPTFDCVPCNKSFPKIHFLFVLSICLSPRLLSPLSPLIVIPYPFDPGI